jgi:hypothetical protein
MTFEGTGKIPDRGLYDTIVSWNVKIEMAGGVRMTFKGGRDSTRFIGTEGWIRVSRGGWDAEPKSLLDEADLRSLERINHYQNFIDAVKAREGAITSISEAVRSDVISHMSDICIRLNRKITWDPKTEQIVGDAEAAKMCHRPMRAPWTL